MISKECISHPLIHDLFKSTLTYHYFKVIGKIYHPVNSSIFTNDKQWLLSRVQQERYIKSQKEYNKPYVYGGGYLDCVWEFDQIHETLGLRKNLYRIFHEVKSGMFDPNDIFEKYSSKYYKKHFKVFGSNSQFWIWAWEHHINNVVLTNEDAIKLYKRGVLKFIPLEYILPIVIDELNDNGFKYVGPEFKRPKKLPKVVIGEL